MNISEFSEFIESIEQHLKNNVSNFILIKTTYGMIELKNGLSKFLSYTSIDGLCIKASYSPSDTLQDVEEWLTLEQQEILEITFTNSLI